MSCQVILEATSVNTSKVPMVPGGADGARLVPVFFIFSVGVVLVVPVVSVATAVPVVF
ncbi:hypothetical protein HanIR_Chr08g0376111 [Helianthus annuus]|nr:hypothetical protein HanIR_Chr08g0376111 [Helianthus annuus]